jgi:hypothetical protein
MWMIELTMKTATADSRMGIQSAGNVTMGGSSGSGGNGRTGRIDGDKPDSVKTDPISPSRT